MATTVNRNVNIYIQSGEAEKAYDRLIKKEQQLKKELENATDPKIIKKLESELDKLQEPLDRAGKKVRGELNPSFRDLQNTVNTLGRRLKQMSEQDADFTKILAQYNAANVSLKEQKKNIDNIQAATKTGVSESKGLGTAVGTILGNIGFNVLDTLKNIGIQAIKTALETEGVKNAFNRLNQPDLLNNLRTATKGTVNDLELMKRAVAANNFQIPLEKLGTLLDFAQRRARETGQSVDYLVDSIVTGIARKSPLILDNLGINIQRINEEFKKTGDFAKAAFNVVDEELAKAGPALETNADKVDRLKAIWENFLGVIGTGLVDATDSILNGFAKFGLFVDGNTRALAVATDYVQKYAAEQEAVRKEELQKVNQFRNDFANTDKEGRDLIIKNVQFEIKTLVAFQKQALTENNQTLAQQLQVRLNVWKQFNNDLIKINQNSNDTIANLQKEIQSVTEIRDNSIIGSNTFNEAVARLKVLQDRLDKLLGKNQEKPKEDLFGKFNQQLQDQAQLLDAYNKAQIDKDLTANDIKYDKLRQQFIEAFKKRQLTEKELGELLNQNEDLRGREQSLIYQKWVDEINKNRLAEDKKTQEKLKQQDLNRLQQLLSFQETIAKAAAESADKALGKRQFELEVDELLATGKKKTEIRVQQLELERDLEIANAEKTGHDVADINRKYQKLIADEKVKGIVDLVSNITGFIQNTANVLNSFFDAANQRDQQQLEDDRIANDKKKENYKRQLDGKLISQKEYDKKVQQIDKQQDEREKQARLREFNRNKITNLINTSITVSRGIAEALATPPVPNVGLAAFMGVLGGIQLAFIAAQKPPKLAKGGFLDGPTHSQGGMPIINPVSGRKVAEVEGGEVVLSRSTVRNNAALVDQLLHSSLYKNGAPVVPKWKNSSPNYLNIPVLNESMHQVRMFEKGGVLSNGSSDSDASAANTAVIANLQGSIEALNAQLSAGIYAYMYISQSEKQQQRIDSIRADALVK